MEQKITCSNHFETVKVVMHYAYISSLSFIKLYRNTSYDHLKANKSNMFCKHTPIPSLHLTTVSSLDSIPTKHYPTLHPRTLEQRDIHKRSERSRESLLYYPSRQFSETRNHLQTIYNKSIYFWIQPRKCTCYATK